MPGLADAFKLAVEAIANSGCKETWFAKVIGHGIFGDDVNVSWILKNLLAGECWSLVQEESARL